MKMKKEFGILPSVVFSACVLALTGVQAKYMPVKSLCVFENAGNRKDPKHKSVQSASQMSSTTYAYFVCQKKEVSVTDSCQDRFRVSAVPTFARFEFPVFQNKATSACEPEAKMWTQVLQHCQMWGGEKIGVFSGSSGSQRSPGLSYDELRKTQVWHHCLSVPETESSLKIEYF